MSLREKLRKSVGGVGGGIKTKTVFGLKKTVESVSAVGAALTPDIPDILRFGGNEKREMFKLLLDPEIEALLNQIEDNRAALRQQQRSASSTASKSATKDGGDDAQAAAAAAAASSSSDGGDHQLQSGHQHRGSVGKADREREEASTLVRELVQRRTQHLENRMKRRAAMGGGGGDGGSVTSSSSARKPKDSISVKSSGTRDDELDEDEDDCVEMMLDMLGGEVMGLETEQFDLVERKHEMMLDDVLRTLAANVTASHAAFVRGLREVEELNGEVNLMMFILKKGRRHLAQAENELQHGGLVILSKFRRKQATQEVLNLMRRLRDLVEKQRRFNEVLSSSHFHEAWLVAEELEDVHPLVMALDAAKPILNSFQQVEKQLTARLDRGIKELTRNFSKNTADQLLHGYGRVAKHKSTKPVPAGQRKGAVNRSLDSTLDDSDDLDSSIISAGGGSRRDATSVDMAGAEFEEEDERERIDRMSKLGEKLVVEFVNCIRSAAFDVAFSYALANPSQTVGAESLQAMKYEELIVFLPENQFLACLMRTLEILCDVMFAMHNLTNYINEYLHSCPPHEESGIAALASALGGEGTKPVSADVKDKGGGGRGRVWSEAQRRVGSLLAAPKFAQWKMHTFLKVIYTTELFIRLGEDFSDTANALRGSIRAQSKAYYEGFHRDQVLLAFTHLEAETWTPFPPVPLKQIRELQGFAASMGGRGILEPPRKGGAGSGENMLDKMSREGNPIRNAAAAQEQEESKRGQEAASELHQQRLERLKHRDSIDEDEDEDDELRQDYVDEEGKRAKISAKERQGPRAVP